MNPFKCKAKASFARLLEDRLQVNAALCGHERKGMADPTYVAWWFRHYGFYTMDRPFFLEENARRVAEQDGAHPGFSQSLRVFALEALTSGDEAIVRRALSALAVVGELGDIPAIRSASSGGGPGVTKDAGTAVYEIEHRTPAA